MSGHKPFSELTKGFTPERRAAGSVQGRGIARGDDAGGAS
jgi:hypothetical protein